MAQYNSRHDGTTARQPHDVGLYQHDTSCFTDPHYDKASPQALPAVPAVFQPSYSTGQAGQTAVILRKNIL